MTTNPSAGPCHRQSVERPKASWPTAVGWWFVGWLLTVVTFSVAGSLGRAEFGGLGAAGLQLVAAFGVGIAVLVGRRLPRRARAMFVTGVLTPIVLGLAVLVWIIWAFSQSNFTF